MNTIKDLIIAFGLLAWILNQYLIIPKQNIYNEFIKRRCDFIDEVISFMELYFENYLVDSQNFQSNEKQMEYLEGFCKIHNKILLYGTENEQNIYENFFQQLKNLNDETFVKANKYYLDLKEEIKKSKI